MNILHLEDESWDSGIAHYALTLAAEQVRRGHHVAVWGLKNSRLLKDAAARGLPTRGFAEAPMYLLELPALRRDAAEFAPQILNAHTGSAHALALLLAPRTAAVVRTRGDARAPSANALTRLIASRTDLFIAANTLLKSALETAFPGRPVRLVLQGLEGPARIPPLPAAPIVGMIARLDPVKGHEILVDAAQILKPLVPGLKVLCAGKGALRDRFLWQLGPLGLSTTVEFPGHVDDKWAFIAGGRIGVVASIDSEAVSRAALEWMAAGRPLVATRVGGLPDIVEDGVTGLLVEPEDGKALAEAIKTLLSDPARAEAMGRKARQRWEERFSPPPFYAATQRAYEDALSALSR